MPWLLKKVIRFSGVIKDSIEPTKDGLSLANSSTISGFQNRRCPTWVWKSTITMGHLFSVAPAKLHSEGRSRLCHPLPFDQGGDVINAVEILNSGFVRGNL